MWPCGQRPASGTSRGKTAGRTGSVPVPGGSGPVRPMTSASRHDETKGGKLWHRIRHSMTSARPATLRHPMIWTCGLCMPVFCRMCAPAGSSSMPVAARGGTRWLSGRRASGWRPSMLRRRWPGRQRSCWGRRCPCSASKTWHGRSVSMVSGPVPACCMWPRRICPMSCGVCSVPCVPAA